MIPGSLTSRLSLPRGAAAPQASAARPRWPSRARRFVLSYFGSCTSYSGGRSAAPEGRRPPQDWSDRSRASPVAADAQTAPCDGGRSSTYGVLRNRCAGRVRPSAWVGGRFTTRPWVRSQGRRRRGFETARRPPPSVACLSPSARRHPLGRAWVFSRLRSVPSTLSTALTGGPALLMPRRLRPVRTCRARTCGRPRRSDRLRTTQSSCLTPWRLSAQKALRPVLPPPPLLRRPAAGGFSCTHARGPSPVASGRCDSHAAMSDSRQRTARCPIRIGSGNRFALISR